jgi:hypothetical protein
MAGARWRRREQPGLDLAVAVRADEHALRGLGAVGRKRLAARAGHAEGLRRGIDVVEVQVDDTAVVAADGAAAARLLDQDSPHLLMATGHGFADAPLAAPAEPPRPAL